MIVSVTNKSTGYTVMHENVARISENSQRFELIDYRQRNCPFTSTSYHKSLYTYTIVVP